MYSLCELHQLTHYYGTTCALRDVSLDLQCGAIGLVGQNGAGKSTLIQIMLGLIRPTQGTAIVLGMDAARAGVRLRAEVGYMPERAALVPGLTGVEYVALAGELSGMPRRDAMRRAHEALSYVDLEEARYRQLVQYSTGMVQRLKLAATIVHDPQLLLLDEPTAGLDPEGRATMLQLLREYVAQNEKSLILSTHLLGDVQRVCSTTVILDQGQVKGRGGIDQLRDRRRRCYRIRWEGDATAMMQRLQALGIQASPSPGGEALLTMANELPTSVLFEQALEHQVRITHLESEIEDLQAIYHRLIQPQSPQPVGEVESV